MRRNEYMFLTLFLSIVVCGAITLLLVGGVAFYRDIRLFSSAPKEVRELLIQRDKELFYGARTIGLLMMVFGAAMILGAFAVAVWDGSRNTYTFIQFFLRFVMILTAYKVYDMVFFDGFLLCRYRFFQHYYPETAPALNGRRFGFNLKSQLLKLLLIFPGIAALMAFVCTRFT